LPRQAREKSESGYYHIMVRGNEQRKIFMDNSDREKYLDILSKQVHLNRIEISAYCLMDNHLHLLIKEIDNELSKALQSIGTAYVIYFNKKYSRVGHLFQNRFKSEPIKDENYLFGTLRYIHQNPIRAGICNRVEDYPWSSDCYYRNSSRRSFVTNHILKHISNNHEQAVVEYCRMMKIPETKSFIDDNNPPMTNEQLSKVIKQELDSHGIADPLEKLHRNVIKQLVSKFHKEYGASMQLIANELGISKSMVQRLLRKDNLDG
jgi:putative transposase